MTMAHLWSSTCIPCNPSGWHRNRFQCTMLVPTPKKRVTSLRLWLTVLTVRRGSRDRCAIGGLTAVQSISPGKGMPRGDLIISNIGAPSIYFCNSKVCGRFLELMIVFIVVSPSLCSHINRYRLYGGCKRCHHLAHSENHV
jgi:hypothetical protein